MKTLTIRMTTRWVWGLVVLACWGAAVEVWEVDVLREFYGATGGGNWKVQWNLTEDPCQFHGIQCVDSKITAMRLSGNLLWGSIPDSVGNLTGLEGLDLSVNYLSGTLPTTLGYLTRLTLLDTSFNRLSSTIPTELGRLTNLNSITFSYNFLVGSVPETLNNLLGLKSINFAFNTLYGSIPPFFGDFVDLNHLSLSGNQLSGEIPVEIGHLVSLKTLELDKNGLGGNIPDSIGNLTSLELLNLMTNELGGTLPSSIGSLVSLQLLYLSENQLNGAVPEEISQIPYLKQLHLAKNHLTGSIPSALAQLKSLNALNLADNQLSGPLPSILSSFPSLFFLDLSGNQFCGGCLGLSVSICNAEGVLFSCDCQGSLCGTQCTQNLTCPSENLSPSPTPSPIPSPNTGDVPTISPTSPSRYSCSQSGVEGICVVDDDSPLSSSILENKGFLTVASSISKIYGNVSVPQISLDGSHLEITGSWMSSQGLLKMLESILLIDKDMVFINGQIEFNSLSSSLHASSLTVLNTTLIINVNNFIGLKEGEYDIIQWTSQGPLPSLTLSIPTTNDANCKLSMRQEQNKIVIVYKNVGCSAGTDNTILVKGVVGGLVGLVLLLGCIAGGFLIYKYQLIQKLLHKFQKKEEALQL